MNDRYRAYMKMMFRPVLGSLCILGIFASEEQNPDFVSWWGRAIEREREERIVFVVQQVNKLKAFGLNEKEAYFWLKEQWDNDEVLQDND